MWKSLTGRRSSPVPNTVEAGAVRKFAQAIGDLNPLYLDEESAGRSRWKGRIAPPTFPRTFDYGQIEGLELPKAGMIHGEQTYTYTRPLRVGESVLCHALLRDVFEKDGKGGKMTFLVFERVGVDGAGERVFTAEEVVIVTAAVQAGVGA